MRPKTWICRAFDANNEIMLQSRIQAPNMLRARNIFWATLDEAKLTGQPDHVTILPVTELEGDMNGAT